jgi:feruloyl-CoA synthase
MTPDRPVMILSDNGIENGLLQLGAMYAGIPVAPTSPAYSLVSRDFGKLKHVFELVRPGLVFAADGELFDTALGALPTVGRSARLSAPSISTASRS